MRFSADLRFHSDTAGHPLQTEEVHKVRFYSPSLNNSFVLVVDDQIYSTSTVENIVEVDQKTKLVVTKNSCYVLSNIEEQL